MVKRRVRCIKSELGEGPICREGEIYEVDDEFRYGADHYLRIRLAAGSSINACAANYIDVGVSLAKAASGFLKSKVAGSDETV